MSGRTTLGPQKKSTIISSRPGRASSSTLWKKSSAASLRSLVPHFEEIKLSLRDFCEILPQRRNLWDARISSVKGWKQGIHRFVVLSLIRPDGKPKWLRLDRRLDTQYSMKKFFGITDANDQAVISLDENSLTIGATHEEGRTLTYDIRLSEIEMILKAIIKELPSYRLWQENCWLFSAIIHRFFAEIEGDSAWGTTRPHWQKSALDAQDRVLSYYWAHRRSQGATPPIPNIGSSASHSSWVQPNFLGGPTTHQPRQEYSRDEAEQQYSSFIPRTSSPEPLNDSLPLESFQPISREPTSSEENRQRKIPTISRKRSFGLHFPVPVEQDILGLEIFPNTSFPHHRPHKPIPRARRVSFGRTPKLSPEFSAVHPDRSPVACADERKLSPVTSLPIEPPSRAISSANAPIMPPTTSSPSLKRRKVEFEEGYYAEQSDDPHTPTYEHHTKRVCVRTDLFELTSNVKKRSSYDEDSDDDIIIGDEQSTIHTSAAPSRW